MHRTIVSAVLAIALYIGAPGMSSAQGFRLTFPGNKATYQEIFTEIEKKGSVWFAYMSQDFEGTAPVEVPQGSRLSLGEILDLIFAGTDYRYKLDGKHIFITKEARPGFITPETYIRSSVNPGTSRRRGGSRELIREAVDSTFKEIRYVPAAVPAFLNFGDIGGTPVEIDYPFPDLAVKVNLLNILVAQAPNLAVEFATGRFASLELSVSYDPWGGRKSGRGSKPSHIVVRPELRRWLDERYNGHFFGGHAFYAGYNMAGRDFPLAFKKGYEYDGWAVGAGLTYGYHQPLSRNWGVEFSIGLGAAYMDHKRTSAAEVVQRSKMYVGPTRAGISVVYIIK